jgi:1-aminocyclopropane-1-carboxylate deaminase
MFVGRKLTTFAATAMELHHIRLQSLKKEYQPLHADVLRLDEAHPQVSGNKWFKLRFHIENAKQHNTAIVTFGGAWSNHILATAITCREERVPCIGIIRGEQPQYPSQTLQDTAGAGMQLHYITRADYREKNIPAHIKEQLPPAVEWIPEGGYGPLGAAGAATIAAHFDAASYSHIVLAAGTGTTMAGLVQAVGGTVSVVGIPC